MLLRTLQRQHVGDVAKGFPPSWAISRCKHLQATAQVLHLGVGGRAASPHASRGSTDANLGNLRTAASRQAAGYALATVAEEAAAQNCNHAQASTEDDDTEDKPEDKPRGVDARG
jgi:hypothetical protein